MDLLSLYLSVAFLTWILTGLIRRYAISRSIMDVPNARSSHSIPTPRGGGVAIIITFLVGLVILWKISLLGNELFVALIGAGLCVSIIGFMDDKGHIAARWRLLAHFCAAGWMLFMLGGLPPLLFFGIEFDLSWAGNLIALISLVWLLNLYNFMDGIDGIAGVEALSTTLVAGLLMMLVIDHQGAATLNILMFAAVAGFLVWNFPSAKIFMGDAGSGFLGLMLGGFSLYSAHISPKMFWVWLILLGVFIVDATYTLARRLFRGDKVYEAHRSHAYQYAARKYKSHLKVTFFVLAINLLWLAPIACFVALGFVDGFIAMLISYVPLVLFALYLRAGNIE